MPTPYELSRVGATEDDLADDDGDGRWIGKDALMGSEWEAVK